MPRVAAHVDALPRISINLRTVTLLHDPPPFVAEAYRLFFSAISCVGVGVLLARMVIYALNYVI